MIVRWGIVRRWLPYVAMGMATLALLTSIGLWLDGKHRDAVACHYRNEERAIHRTNLNDQIDQTRELPDVVFERLELTKADTLGRLRARKAKLPPVPCPADPLRWIY